MTIEIPLKSSPSPAERRHEKSTTSPPILDHATTELAASVPYVSTSLLCRQIPQLDSGITTLVAIDNNSQRILTPEMFDSLLPNDANDERETNYHSWCQKKVNEENKLKENKERKIAW